MNTSHLFVLVRQQNGLENQVVMPFEPIITDSKITVVKKMDLRLRLAAQFTVGWVTNLSTHFKLLLFTLFETFCWSDNIKVFGTFKLLIDVIISFWILHFLMFLWYSHFECFSYQLFQKVLSYFDFLKTMRCFTQ